MQIKQVNVVAKLTHYVIDVLYNKEFLQPKLAENRVASIDISLNNLTTLTFNQAKITSILNNGKPLTMTAYGRSQ